MFLSACLILSSLTMTSMTSSVMNRIATYWNWFCPPSAAAVNAQVLPTGKVQIWWRAFIQHDLETTPVKQRMLRCFRAVITVYSEIHEPWTKVWPGATWFTVFCLRGCLWKLRRKSPPNGCTHWRQRELWRADDNNKSKQILYASECHAPFV